MQILFKDGAVKSGSDQVAPYIELFCVNAINKIALPVVLMNKKQYPHFKRITLTPRTNEEFFSFAIPVEGSRLTHKRIIERISCDTCCYQPIL
jgi:hypothetical protein